MAQPTATLTSIAKPRGHLGSYLASLVASDRPDGASPGRKLVSPLASSSLQAYPSLTAYISQLASLAFPFFLALSA